MIEEEAADAAAAGAGGSTLPSAAVGASAAAAAAAAAEAAAAEALAAEQRAIRELFESSSDEEEGEGAVPLQEWQQNQAQRSVPPACAKWAEARSGGGRWAKRHRM